MSVLDHLDKLPVFLAVAEHGTALGPSKALNLSQPSITRAIQTLEHSLGYALFTRSRSGMALTEGGKVFYEYAARIVKEAQDGAEKGAHAQDEMSGKIMIGTFETLADYLWPDFLARAQREFPLLQISLKTNSQHEHKRNLENGALDLLVDAEPRDLGGLSQWFLYADKFGFFSGSKISEELAPAAAANHPILMVRGVFDEHDLTLEEHLRRRGFYFPREMSFDSFTTVRKMTAKGLGIGILPLRLAAEGGKLHPVRLAGFPPSFGTHRIYATISSFREKDKRVKALVSLLKKQLG